MTSITSLNKPQFNHVIEQDTPFVKLSELQEETVHKVHLLYINTGGYYGDSPVAAIDGKLVNLPSHLTDTVRDICANRKLVSDINAGKVGFKVATYQNSHGTQYTVEWVEM